MKKKLFLIIFLIAALQSSCAFANSSYISNPIKIAIKKYKIGNYTGCLQDCQNIIKYDPSNAIAYYYMAMSYAQAGKQDLAIQNYAKVLSLNPKSQLLQYATTGKRCLETPDKCNAKPATAPGETSDLDKFIASPNELSNSVQVDFDKKHLKSIQDEINSDKDIDNYEFRKFKDYSKQHSQIDVTDEKLSQKKPTNDEIVAALRVLNDAGLDAYAQKFVSQPQTVSSSNPTTPYSQSAINPTPEQAQLNMLMNSNNQSGNNAMMSMLPFVTAQNKDGTNNYSPQLMQAVIMNTMMTDFNYNLDNDKDK